MSAPEDTEYLEALERTLDEGMVIQGQASLRLPLLDVSVLSIEEHIVVASFERYLQAAQELAEATDVDTLDALPDDLSDDLPEEEPPSPPEAVGLTAGDLA
jgi:hypothetical protein